MVNVPIWPLKVRTSRLGLCFSIIASLVIYSCSDVPEKKRIERKVNNGAVTLALAKSVFATSPFDFSTNKSEFLLYQVYEGLFHQGGYDISKGRPVADYQFQRDRNLLVVKFVKDYYFSDGTKLDSLSILPWLNYVRTQGVELSYKPSINSLEIKYIDEFSMLEKLCTPKYLLFAVSKGTTIGGGAFAIQSIEAGSGATLKKNEYYPNADSIGLSQINIVFFENIDTLYTNLQKGNVDIAVMDPFQRFIFDEKYARYLHLTFKEEALRDSLVTVLAFSTADTSFHKEMLLIADELSKSNQYTSYDNDREIWPDSIPMINSDSNFFTNKIVQKLFPSRKRTATDSSKSINVLTLKVKHTEYGSNSNQQQIATNYWSGKVVYQYYIKNIEYFNEGILDLKKVYLERAETLNR